MLASITLLAVTTGEVGSFPECSLNVMLKLALECGFARHGHHSR